MRNNMENKKVNIPNKKFHIKRSCYTCRHIRWEYGLSCCSVCASADTSPFANKCVNYVFNPISIRGILKEDNEIIGY